MKKRGTDLEALFAGRRKKLLRQIPGEAALVCSAPVKFTSRDLELPYRQDSDLYYLTGFHEPNAALVLLGTSKGPRSVLYLDDRDPEQERWHGERLGVRRAKRRFRVDEVRDVKNLQKELPGLLSGCCALHFAAGVNPQIDGLVWKHFCSNQNPRGHFPQALRDVRCLTAEMRFLKDREEIRAMKRAADITADAFMRIAPQLKREVSSELHGAKLLESYFSRFGADGLAFPTLFASGKNATALHRLPELQQLWKRELVLIDAGASFRGYCADMTRVFPVSGQFSPAQLIIYKIVLAGVKTAVSHSKPGATLAQIHEATVRTITEGLVEAKILKRSVHENITTEKYKRYFMHGTGHFLGLDVHDISPVTFEKPGQPSPARLRPLVPGNAFTIEPGIYIDSDDEKAPKRFRGIGIRLEEDVVITESGCTVLTAKMPIEPEDIEALML